MSEFKAKERKTWNEAWKAIDQTMMKGSIWEYWDGVKLKFLLKLFPKPEDHLTLECGCGAATISTWLSKLGHKTIAVDFSKEALRAARNNFKMIGAPCNLILCDVESLPFKESVFDVVMSFGLFEHFSDPKPHIQEMIRVLEHGGLLFVDAIPKRFNIQTIVDNFTCRLYPIIKRKKENAFFYPRSFEIQMNAKQLKEFFEQFKLLGLKVIGNNPFPNFPNLPAKLDKIYIKSVRKLRRFHQIFDGSWLALHFGRGLWVYGFKMTEMKRN